MSNLQISLHKLPFVHRQLATLAMAAALLLPMLSSCGSGKGAATNAAGSYSLTEIPADIAQQTPQQRYVSVCQTYSDWQDVSMPVKLSLNTPKSASFSARAAMKRNEWINISVRMLGFEVASVWVDNDSIHAIDKYHKRYVSESVTSLLAGTALTVADIQDLLLGRGCLISANGGTFTSAMLPNFSFESTEVGLIVTPTVQPTAYNYGYILAPDANNIKAASVAVDDEKSATITYSNFLTSTAGNMAANADIVLNASKQVSASVEWSLSSAKWNVGESRTWKQPSGYTRISAESLLKALSSL